MKDAAHFASGCPQALALSTTPAVPSGRGDPHSPPVPFKHDDRRIRDAFQQSRTRRVDQVVSRYPFAPIPGRTELAGIDSTQPTRGFRDEINLSSRHTVATFVTEGSRVW